MSLPASLAVLALLAAAQLGFQVTVTLLVYPALTEAPDADWEGVHDRHSRRIVAPVVVLYGGLLLALPWAWLSAPSGWVALAGACCLGLLATTALLAAPTHGRLGRSGPGERPVLLRRLLLVDRARLAWSLALAGCTAGALLLSR
ncbi:hypothetical protein [Nocardioides marmoraquaticus]